MYILALTFPFFSSVVSSFSLSLEAINHALSSIGRNVSHRFYGVDVKWFGFSGFVLVLPLLCLGDTDFYNRPPNAT